MIPGFLTDMLVPPQISPVLIRKLQAVYLKPRRDFDVWAQSIRRSGPAETLAGHGFQAGK
jgi:hypothetical protein